MNEKRTCTECKRQFWPVRIKQVRCEDCRAAKAEFRDAAKTGRGQRKARDLSPANVARRNALVEDNAHVAHIHAKKMYKRIDGKAEMGDLLSGAFTGLLIAADKYDPDRGVKFSSFASHHVVGGIVDEIRAIDPARRLQRERAKALDAAESSFYTRNGRKPTDDELRAAMGLSEEQFELESRDARGAIGISSSDVDADWMMEHAAAPPADEAARRDWWEVACKGLCRREKAIVLLYYRDGLTYPDIGKVLGVSPSRVAQLLARLLIRLRQLPHIKRLMAEESAHAA